MYAKAKLPVRPLELIVRLFEADVRIADDFSRQWLESERPQFEVFFEQMLIVNVKEIKLVDGNVL